MTAELLYEAIGEIREDLIVDAEDIPRRQRRPRWQNLLAACLTLVLIVLPVSAEMTTGYISNLLMPLYGGAQTQIVENIGVPINASTTVAGYTLTADAVIGDRYNIAVVYSLRREDGGELPEGLVFDTYGNGLGTVRGFSLGGGSGGGSYSHEMSEDRRTLKIIQEWTGSSRLFFFQRTIAPVFSDLVIHDREAGTYTLWQQGTWSLQFTIRYKDTTRTIPLRNRNVVGYNGVTYTIKRACISPIGLHLDLTCPRPDTTGMEIGSQAYANAFTITSEDFQVELLLTDGNRIVLDDWNMGGHGSEGKRNMTWDYGASFDEPIPQEDIQAIIVCGTEIPIN